MARNYDLPNGDRIWELASEAVRIENSAKESVGFSYKLFESMVSYEADRAMRTMDPVEQCFFVMCFQGGYVAPELRGGGDLIEAGGISDLFPNGSLEELEQAQRKIDAHIKRRCLSLERGTWPGDDLDGPLPSYTKEAVYPSISDDYDNCESPSQIMALNVLPNSKSELNEIYETNQGEFQPSGVTNHHLVARFSEEGTRWAIAGFYQDNLDDWFDRTTIVSTFDSLKDASQWVKSELQAMELRAGQDTVYVPNQDEDLRHVMRPEDFADPEKRAEFWQTHSDPVQKTLVSLSPEDEEVRRVFIMERNVLPAQRTEVRDIQQTAYGPFQARGEIAYDLVAKVSAAGTTWAIAAQHYDWDDFADRGPRLVEVVHSFDSLEEAKAWLASDRALVTRELTDPRKDLEHIVASVISTPEFEQALMEQGYSLSTFQRDWPKYGSFMALPQDYRAAINWAEHEIKARGMDQTREVEMER
jgi:hypothetical protein